MATSICSSCGSSCYGSVCTYCGVQLVTIQSTENGPVHTIARGRHLRVSDRNGNPKNLVPIADSLLVGRASSLEFRDGSVDKPVAVNLQDLTYGKTVVVQTDGNIIGVVPPEDSEDAFFGQKGGVVKFFKDRQDNVFQSPVGRSGGRLAILSCVNNDTVNLEFLSGQEGYIKVDADGNINVLEDVELEVLCDLEEITDFEEIAHTIVCTASGLRKFRAPETAELTGGEMYAGVDTGYNGGVVAIPTLNFSLPVGIAFYEVRLDASIIGSGTVNSGYAFVVNGTQLYPCGGGSIVSGWFGSAEVDVAVNGMFTTGWAISKLAPGAHTFSMVKCSGNRNPLRISLTAQWRPITA